MICLMRSSILEGHVDIEPERTLDPSLAMSSPFGKTASVYNRKIVVA